MEKQWRQMKDKWRQYSPYFVDIWQYVVLIVLFLLAALFYL